MESDSYKTIKSFSQGIFRDRGSRFIANAYPVSDPESVKPIVDGLRKEFHDARHHCYAYMIGHERTVWRVNDDGEPSGTAGKPILGQINSHGLTNVLIVVIRYFGGTLLGVPGLINAYRSAAAEAISGAEIIECTVQDYYEITFPYSSMNDVMKILKDEAAGQSDQTFDLECRMIINFRLVSQEKIIGRLSRIDGLKLRFLEKK
ncbi:MAG TPA: YigZ family protein [Bacteroidales bacterium]|nr:MAG: YigZ family protein [Bacteroidetes bacterium GWC2_40_22]HBH83234.1 YigZ family protein [Bacteroidales bacterium]